MDEPATAVTGGVAEGHGKPGGTGSPGGTAQVRAAGAVVWRPGPEGLEIALVHRPRYDDWSFPKGKVASGEHLLRAAVREVAEETGIRPVLGRRLPSTWYLKDGRLKQVDYWAATGAGGAPPAGEEVDKVDWLPLAAAGQRLTYPHDGEVLREFAAGPARTTPYIIVRHTSAGDKREWPGDDLLRPLDPRGRAEAGELAELMACFGPARVVSSATARCLETVVPFAAQTGAGICADRAFTIGSWAPAADRLAGLLAGEHPTIVCTHGELIPCLLSRACKELGAEPPAEPALRKGHFWVLHVAGGRLVSAERHAPHP
jgi:8-oxo-dGTP pyrophosphatase MutT (NUDIX family)/phosphohistidine phosphatase SixA